MAITSRTCQLPVELMSVVIDWVGVEGLLLLCAVSTNWRAVAHSHPLFWRDIRLRALSSTALSFFHARLDRAHGRDINLAIQLVGQPSRWRVTSIVLPAVTRHLSHIVTLTVTLKYNVHAAALDALTVPAPNLQRLDIGFFDCPRGSPAVLLVPDLFARSTPKLVAVSLSNIKFPLQRISAFETVTSLHFYFKEPRFPLHGIFHQFPRLTALEVVVEDGCTGVEAASTVDKIATRRLSSLQLCMHTSGYGPMFDRIPYLHAIPAVSCWQPHPEQAGILLGHLDGPIEMELRGPSPESGTVRIALYAPACARTRTFIELDYELEDAAVPGVCLQAIAARVTTLRISAQLAYAAPLFAELPACCSLEVVLDGDAGLPASDGEDMPAAPLRLPALTTVTVKAVGSCVGRISAEDLSAFLDALVSRTGQRPALRLEYVRLTESLGSLSHHFDMECHSSCVP